MLTVLQARASSSRLPGKVLLSLLGRPMLARQIERVLRADAVGPLVIATSTEPADDAIEALGDTLGVAVARGSLNDVLDRFYRAALPYRPVHVIRLTGDCPLADRQVIDRVATAHLESGADYTSNARPASFPDGLDVEVCRFAALETAWREATLPSDREHVMPFLWRQPERFAKRNVTNDRDLSGLRWTVDEAADFAFVTAVYEALHPAEPDFLMADILALLAARPELAALNGGFLRDEGYARSLRDDAAAAVGRPGGR